MKSACVGVLSIIEL